MLLNVRDGIESALQEAVRELVPEGAVPDLELGRAKNPSHGDYASPAGMKLARALRRPPPEIAAEVARRIKVPEDAAAVEVAGGYVNFRLSPRWLGDLAVEVAARGSAYGGSAMGGGRRVQVEFASVNPTGPLHIGHGRGVVLGDALSRLLEFTGHAVQREYYVNDDNAQAEKFGASVYARLHGKEPPEGGYVGQYVADLAEAARESLSGIEDMPEAEAEPVLRRFAIERMISTLAASVGRLGVRYDEWFWESRLWQEGLPQRAIERLREGGHLKEHDGALWFAPDVSGWEDNDEDRVVIRSNGQPTYFASDLGYLLSKFEDRAFDRGIVVWGADHHGYVPRIKGAMAALGIDPDRLHVILNQMVNLKESAAGQGKMSKRAGRFVTIDELVDMVGPDAVRYFYLLRSPDTTLDFDLELAVSQSKENPVFYAQYAHARLANVEVVARERHPDLPARARMELIDKPWELDVLRQVALWPEAVEEAALLTEPHRIPYYVHDLADRVHALYDRGNREGSLRLVVDDPELTRARLELARAARHTLKSALDLMGVSAPDRM